MPTASPDRDQPECFARQRASALPPDERRRAIVEAAKPLVARLGRQVTTRQIAEAAGVAEGTLFRVFADKDEIVVATAQALLDPQILEEELASLDRHGPIEQQLGDAVEIIHGRTTGVFQLMSLLGPELRALLKRPMGDSDALIDLLTPFADRLRTDPRRAARHLRATVLALAHPMLIEEPFPVDEIVNLFAYGALRPLVDAEPRTEPPAGSGATPNRAVAR